MPAPLTVLLPARNAAPTLDAAVASVLADVGNAPTPVRLLAIDDGSTDGTGALLRTWADRDRRVEVIAGEGKGISAALNLGLSKVGTPRFARMDADDLWLPGRLAAQQAALDGDPALALVGGRVELFRDDGALKPGMAAYQRWLDGLTTPESCHRDRFVESPLVHPAWMGRTEALHALGGWHDPRWPEDHDLLLRAFAAGMRLGNVATPVLRWRDHATRLTRTDGRYGRPALVRMKAHFLAREPFVRRRLTLLGAGPTGLALLRALRDDHGIAFQRLVEVHPRKVGTRIEGLPVIGYGELGLPSEEEHLLVAIGVPEGRAQAREWLTARGFSEGLHFTCVA